MHRPVSQFKVTVILADKATAGYSGTLLHTYKTWYKSQHTVSTAIIIPNITTTKANNSLKYHMVSINLFAHDFFNDVASSSKRSWDKQYDN